MRLKSALFVSGLEMRWELGQVIYSLSIVHLLTNSGEGLRWIERRYIARLVCIDQFTKLKTAYTIASHFAILACLLASGFSMGSTLSPTDVGNLLITYRPLAMIDLLSVPCDFVRPYHRSRAGVGEGG